MPAAVISNRSHTVLVIEDDPILREALRQLLTARGFEALTVPTADAARNWIAGILPDAITLDVRLPGTNGLDFLRELRRSERTRYLPVLLVSSIEPSREVLQAMALGATDFIAKPVIPDVLVGKLEAHLRYGDALVRLERYSELLARAGAFDPLTQLFTQRWLPELLAIEVERASLRHLPLTVALIEPDVILNDFAPDETRFRNVGSREEAVQTIARRLEGSLREADALARYTEDSFCAVLPGLDLHHAATVAERMRDIVESRPLPSSGGSAFPALTIGLACMAPGTKGAPMRLLDGARLALEEARAAVPRRIALRPLSATSSSEETADRLSRTAPLDCAG